MGGWLVGLPGSPGMRYVCVCAGGGKGRGLLSAKDLSKLGKAPPSPSRLPPPTRLRDLGECARQRPRAPNPSIPAHRRPRAWAGRVRVLVLQVEGIRERFPLSSLLVSSANKPEYTAWAGRVRDAPEQPSDAASGLGVRRGGGARGGGDPGIGGGAEKREAWVSRITVFDDKSADSRVVKGIPLMS